MLRDPLERAVDRVRRCDPHEEHRIDLVQAGIETLRPSEIPAHDIEMRRQIRSVRISSHRAKAGTRGSQLIDNVTPDVSSGSGDEDAIHSLISLAAPPAS